MKIQVLWKFGSILILLSVIATGCRKSSAPQKTSEQPADSVLAFQPVPNEDETQIAADPSEDLAMPDPEVLISNPQIPLPPGVTAGGPLSEVIRFAESGVEENVILAYISNSRTSFDLGPDEIIYLNDLGVPASVITRMLEQNVALKKALARPGLQTNFAAAPSPPLTTPSSTDTPAPEFVALPAPGSSSPDYSDAPPSEAPPEDYGNSSDFQDALAPYGTWVDVRGYGRCWQPAAVMANPDWRPYFDRGHWISSDCGWYWSSDYTWGWAPFHYGRWFQHAQLGWCWTPGSVWAPSWVTWRYSNDVCGWAPLPPGSRFIPSIGFAFNGRPVSPNFGFGLTPACFAFISFQYFFDSHLSHHGLPVDQATKHFHATVAVTKIVRNHNRVANQGLAPSHVTSVTHRPIQPVRIQELSDGTKVAGNRNEQLDPQGRTLTVYRPHLRSQAAVAHAVSQRTDLTSAPPSNVQVLDPVRIAPHGGAGPRTVVDSSALPLPARQIRLNETDVPTLPVSRSHPTPDHQASTSPAHLDDSSHALPERALRLSPVHGHGGSARVEDVPEKYPPHSLIVIGRKDSRAGERDRYVPPSPAVPVSAPNPVVNENPGSQLQVQSPDQPSQPPQVALPRTPPLPWARPDAVPQQPVEHRVAIQPEQHRPVQPDVPRHVDTPAPTHERVHSAPVESRPPPVHQESAPRPAPPAPAAPAAAANSSGERDTHRR